ncbi:MAG: MarR family winged helix-turn-helix transcriptional regulator [Myxococcaceae bacterium]
MKNGNNNEAQSLGEVLDFMRLLWAVHHALQTTSKRMEREIGITGPQRLVLRVLNQRPGLSAGELSRALHTDPSTLTGILRRLEERKLVQRTADSADARRVRLNVTAEGKRHARERTGTVEAAVKEALEKLSPDSVRQSRKVLTALAESLEAEAS